MTSFHFDIGSRARQADRLIGRVRSELLKALSERKAETGLSQQALAQKLGVHRSLINRQLTGETNLTLRSIADLAWALDMEVSFELKKQIVEAGQNQPAMTSTIEYGQIKYLNGGSKRSTPAAAQDGAVPPRLKSA
jgi:transcriptional regulator with XRE-family HTH domain